MLSAAASERPLAAQAARTSGEYAPGVVAAAVTDLLHRLQRNDGVPAGTIRYDPRPVEPRESDQPGYSMPVTVYLLGEPDSAGSAAVQEVAGAEAGNIETARVCANESLRSCTLGDAVAVFAASAPAVARDSAQVIVKALWLSDLVKQPVHEGVFRLTLLHGPGGWRVVRTETLMIS
ncbi:MAG TPA: hypothetical protein VGX50_11525 [Longimicrobium sp.]|nr:hypothetical protein [Longimicrobium sp.]